MNLPSDTFMLLSYVNTKLRDDFDSLDELCLSLGVEKSQIVGQLADAGFEYNAQQNKFW